MARPEFGTRGLSNNSVAAGLTVLRGMRGEEGARIDGVLPDRGRQRR